MKILPVAVGSRPAIVLIVAYHLDFRVLGQIVVQYGVLESGLSRGDYPNYIFFECVNYPLSICSDGRQ